MSNKITGDQILDKSSSDVWIEYTKEVKKGNEAMKEILKTALEFQSLSKSFGNVKNETEYVELKNKQADAIELGTTNLEKHQKARLRQLELDIKIEKKFDAFTKKEETARKKRESAINKESALRQRLLTQRNKEEASARKEAIQIQKTSSAYARLNAEFQKSKTNYKNLLANSKATTKETKKAKIEFEAYRKKIQLIDKAVDGYNSRLKNSSGLLKNFLAGIGITAGITSFIAIMRNATKLIADFEQQLVGVGKTANLSGQELTDFGNNSIELVTTKLRGVKLDKILELSEVAGQLGIRGSKDILKFSETLARLEVSTNLIGEEGARSIARILNVTDESVGTVDQLGAAIVDLGNNFATTESEIVSSATEIAKGIAIYGASAKQTLALATVTSSLGIKSEVAGSSIQKSYIKIQKAISTGGKSLDSFAKITNLSNKELKDLFKSNSTEVFRRFVEGLGKIHEAGGDVNSTLKELGLTDIRLLKTITPLADRYDELNRALETTNTAYKENTALNIESEKAMDTLKGSVTELGNIWSSLVLEIDKGDGALSRFFKTSVRGFSNFLKDIRNIEKVSSKLTTDKGGILNLLGLGVFADAKRFGEAVSLDQLFDLEGLKDESISIIEESKKEVEKFLKQVSNPSRKNFFTGFSQADLDAQDIMKSKANEINKVLGARKELREELAIEAAKLLVSTDDELDYEQTRLEARKHTIADLQRIIKLLKEKNKEDTGGGQGSATTRTKQTGVDTQQSEQKGIVELYKEQIATVEKLIQLSQNEDEIQHLVKVKKQLQDNLKIVKSGTQIQLDGLDRINTEMDNYVDAIKRKEEAEKKADEDNLKRKDALISKLELINDFVNVSADLGIALIERKISKLEDEKIATDITFDNQIEKTDRLSINEEEKAKKKELIEKERAKKQAIIDRDIAKERARQFKIDKAAAAVTAAIYTAVALIKLWASPGFPAAIPMMVAVGALGAIQIASILAQPVPKYKDGKKKSDNYQGMAIVNDRVVNGKYVREFREDKHGNISSFQGGNVLTHVAKDDIIHKDWNSLLKSYDTDEIMQKANNASILSSLQFDKKQLSEYSKTQHLNLNFDKQFSNMSSGIRREVRDGFRRMNINVNNNNSFDFEAYRNSRLN